MHHAALRSPDGSRYVRVTAYVAPTLLYIPQGESASLTVPLDDTHSRFYNILYSEQEELVGRADRRAEQDPRRGVVAVGTGQRLPGADPRIDGEVDSVLAVRIDDSLVTGLYAVRDPEKWSPRERETSRRR